MGDFGGVAKVTCSRSAGTLDVPRIYVVVVEILTAFHNIGSAEIRFTGLIVKSDRPGEFSFRIVN